MKRSEAVQIISDEISYYDWPYNPESTQLELAHFILKALELEGMLPPPCEQAFNVRIYGSRQQYERCKLDGEHIVNDWEPEE